MSNQFNARQFPFRRWHAGIQWPHFSAVQGSSPVKFCNDCNDCSNLSNDFPDFAVLCPPFKMFGGLKPLHPPAQQAPPPLLTPLIDYRSRITRIVHCNYAYMDIPSMVGGILNYKFNFCTANSNIEWFLWDGTLLASCSTLLNTYLLQLLYLHFIWEIYWFQEIDARSHYDGKHDKHVAWEVILYLYTFIITTVAYMAVNNNTYSRFFTI